MEKDSDATLVEQLLADRRVLEHLPVRLLVVGRDFRIHYLNRTTPGRAMSEFLGTSVLAHIAEQDRGSFRLAFDRAWASGQPVVVELQTMAGTWWEARLARMAPEGTEGFMLCASIDITARKVADRAIADNERLEEQLAEARKMEAIGQLTAGIAHNFNNLLGVILPNTQLCRAEPGRETDPRLADIELAGRRASDMVHQLMLFAGQGSDAALAPVDLAAVASRVADLCRSQLGARVAIAVEAQGEIPQAMARESQIEQTLLTLCVNAYDAFEEAATGEPRIVIAVDAAPGGGARVRVVDNGPGMTEATRLRVFEPFFTTKAVGRGTGLGLASAYAIVTQHGGKIRCESRPGAGASFEMVLPATGAPVPRTAAPAARSEPAVVTALVIDDEPLLRRVVRSVLEHEGYRVLEAADGVEGVFVFEKHHASIGVVILDRSMPAMSGEDALDRLAAIDDRVPVILLSGLGEREWKGRTPSLILAKPADAGTLIDAVRNLAPRPARH